MANNTANPNISEIQTKNGSVYDVAAKRFSGNRNIKFEGDVTAQESGWDGSGEMKVTTTISEGAVGESKIADEAVTNAKVADGAINWDKIAASVKNGTIAGNYNEKLATCAQVKTYVDEAITGHGSYLGQKTVAQVNALTGMNNGDHVSVSDSGSITNPDGSSTSVNAGDNVIYDGTLRKWDCLAGDYKVKQDSKEVSNDSNIKTVDKVIQNENGEVSVTFKEIGKVAAATAADKATKDASGNTITSTYATKSEVQSAISQTHTHSNKSKLDKYNSAGSSSVPVYIASDGTPTACTTADLKAGKDGDGNAITSTYATKTELNSKTDLKASLLTSSDDLDSLSPAAGVKWFYWEASSKPSNAPSVSVRCVMEHINRTGNRDVQNVYINSEDYYYSRSRMSSDTWTGWKKVYYEATSTYSATGTQAVNGTAVASALTPIEARISEIDDGSEYGVTIGTRTYKSVKIGNQLWLAENLDEELGTLGVNEWYYNGRSDKTAISKKADVAMYTQGSDISYADTFGEISPISNYCNCSGTIVFGVAQSADTRVNVRIWSKNYATYKNAVIVVPANTTTFDFNLTIDIGSDFTPWNLNFIIQNKSLSSFGSIHVKNYRLSFGQSDCGYDAITWEQALANEATAKANNYGRLYNWDNVNANISKLGLSGWRVINKKDAQFLASLETDGNNLRLKKLGGKDSYGLGFGGAGYYNNGFSQGNNQAFRCWTSETSSSGSAWQFGSDNPPATVAAASVYTGRSVRLVLDLNPDGSIPDNAKSSTKVTKQNAVVDVSYDTANHKLVQTNSKGVNKDIVGASELWAGKDGSGNTITSTYATKSEVNDKTWVGAKLIGNTADINSMTLISDGSNIMPSNKAGKYYFKFSGSSVPVGVPDGIAASGLIEHIVRLDGNYKNQTVQIIYLNGFGDGYYIRSTIGTEFSDNTGWKTVYYEATSTYSATGTRAVNGTAVASALGNLPRGYDVTFNTTKAAGTAYKIAEIDVTNAPTNTGLRWVIDVKITSINSQSRIATCDVRIHENKSNAILYVDGDLKSELYKEGNKFILVAYSAAQWGAVFSRLSFARTYSASDSSRFCTLTGTETVYTPGETSVIQSARYGNLYIDTYGSAVGSSSVPAYVNSLGRIAPCTTADLKAGKDASGNVITSTYATKTEVNDKNELETKTLTSNDDLDSLDTLSGTTSAQYRWLGTTRPANSPDGNNSVMLQIGPQNRKYQFVYPREVSESYYYWERQCIVAGWTSWKKVYYSARKSNDVNSFSTDDERAYTGKAIAEHVAGNYYTKTEVDDKSNLKPVLFTSGSLNDLKSNEKGYYKLYAVCGKNGSVTDGPSENPQGTLRVENYTNDLKTTTKQILETATITYSRFWQTTVWSAWSAVSAARKSNDVASFTTDDTQAYTGKAIAEYVNSVTQELTAYDVDALWNEDGEATAQSEEG